MSAYDFVQAKYYSPGGRAPARAIVIHMAQGGGTVSWLTHPTNDNSSDFVIEYSGHVVQMVGWADASHSLHVDRPYGPPGSGDYGYFSLDVAKQLLGTGISDPNRYIFAIEVEGYAASGPNDRQMVALKALIADLRRRYSSIKGLLGHRDFQNYKACPGPYVFDELHHGAFTEQQEADVVPLPITDIEPKIVTVGAGTWYDLDGSVLSAGHAALTARVSPYAVGSKRAIYATPGGDDRRLVLVIPTSVAPMPVSGSAEDLAKLENQVSDLSSQLAAQTATAAALSSENTALRAVRVLAVAAATALDKLPRS